MSGTGPHNMTGKTMTRKGRVYEVAAKVDLTDPAHPKRTWSVKIAGIGPQDWGLVTVDATQLTFYESADKLDDIARDIWATLKREHGDQLEEARSIIHERKSVTALANRREKRKLRQIGDAVEVELTRLDRQGQLDRVAWDMVEDRLERRLGFHPRSSYLAF